MFGLLLNIYVLKLMKILGYFDIEIVQMWYKMKMVGIFEGILGFLIGDKIAISL